MENVEYAGAFWDADRVAEKPELTPELVVTGRRSDLLILEFAGSSCNALMRLGPKAVWI